MGMVEVGIGGIVGEWILGMGGERWVGLSDVGAVSYTHLRAHETAANLVCRVGVWGRARGKGRKGSGWQVELGLREGERRGCWWPSRHGTTVKTPRRIARCFFDT
ncbi:hypothetical protein EJB31_05090 [Klebsiella pneumoniae]|nr:hypothetical protein [Klebsiella pneumoniae]